MRQKTSDLIRIMTFVPQYFKKNEYLMSQSYIFSRFSTGWTDCKKLGFPHRHNWNLKSTRDRLNFQFLCQELQCQHSSGWIKEAAGGWRKRTSDQQTERQTGKAKECKKRLQQRERGRAPQRGQTEHTSVTDEPSPWLVEAVTIRAAKSFFSLR